MMMRFFKLINLIFIVLLCPSACVLAQAQTYLNGYAKKIDGEEIAYHAPDPRADRALLIRSQDSTQSIAWETAPVPEGFAGSTVSFVWLFGMDASPELHNFTLSANNRAIITFSNPASAKKELIRLQGNMGVQLQFRITKIDRHKDVMGYAVLTLPSGMIVPGEPVELKVHGETAESNIWYMTFKHPVSEEIETSSQNMLVKVNGKPFQAIQVRIVNLDEPGDVSISTTGQSTGQYLLETGYNEFQYYVTETKIKKEVPLKIDINGSERWNTTCTLEPVRPWTVYLVQHTHTDIGYTRPQSEILPEHLRFIDYALDYCDLTDGYPDDARFRWTCESAWAVEQYLLRRPREQVQRLLKRINEGRIEVTAMLFNMSEIADETALRHMLTPLKDFREHGIEVRTAMQDDVNGIGWCMADFLPDAGVKYLIMGEHGHRALIPFDKPTPFWWMSPSGNRMLAFRGEHYMHGNALLLHTGDLDNFRSALMNYLEMIEWKDYPFDQIALQYSGYVTDNSPPALTPNKVIREWNEKYVWPKLRSATASEFMQYLEENHGVDLDTYQKAWPDWWTDGFGSAAREMAAIREAQTDMIVTTGLFAMGTMMGTDLNDRIASDIRRIYRNILFYDEHTFGAAESITNPYAENSMMQWAEKSSYAWSALKESRMLREEAFGWLQDHLPRYSDPSVTVFNTLNRTRSGPVRLYIDHEIIEPGSAFSILSPDGSRIPVQMASSRSDGTYWELWVEDVPPMGYTSLRIQAGGDDKAIVRDSHFSGSFENDFWKVQIDPADGSVSSLYSKALGKEMVDMETVWKPGQLIYEQLTNRRQLELFTLREEPVRTTLSDIVFYPKKEGPLWTTLSLSGKLEECAIGPVQVEYRFFHSRPVVELSYTMTKKPVTDPEALYVAFPFQMEDPQIVFEGQGGTIRPGIDQLDGTASDWNTVQNFVSIRSGKEQIIVVSPDIPLFHLGGLNLGNFSYQHRPETGQVFSWVMNNYWTTNFRASQEGEMTWKYWITATKDTSTVTAMEFGSNWRIPLTGRVLPEGGGKDFPALRSLLSIEAPNILLINAMPAEEGQGIILHLREIAGVTTEIHPGDFAIHGKEAEISVVDAIGKKLTGVEENFKFKPYSVHFLKLTWNR